MKHSISPQSAAYHGLSAILGVKLVPAWPLTPIITRARSCFCLARFMPATTLGLKTTSMPRHLNRGPPFVWAQLTHPLKERYPMHTDLGEDGRTDRMPNCGTNKVPYPPQSRSLLSRRRLQ